jgi:hypothetical protein
MDTKIRKHALIAVMSVTHLKNQKKPVHELFSIASIKMDVHGHKRL